jgi:hypothetical protein
MLDRIHAKELCRTRNQVQKKATRLNHPERHLFNEQEKYLRKTPALEPIRSDSVPYLIQVLEQAADCRSGTQRSAKINKEETKSSSRKLCALESKNSQEIGLGLWSRAENPDHNSTTPKKNLTRTNVRTRIFQRQEKSDGNEK